jgi:dynein heavy chain, axonemal
MSFTINSNVEVRSQLRELQTWHCVHASCRFNLRDMARVVQGCMRADARSTADVKQLLCLWLHECSRVFEDRLTNSEDHSWFRGRQGELLAKHFGGLGYTDVVTAPRNIFGDFVVPGADPRVYAPITDMGRLVKVGERSTCCPSGCPL